MSANEEDQINSSAYQYDGYQGEEEFMGAYEANQGQEEEEEDIEEDEEEEQSEENELEIYLRNVNMDQDRYRAKTAPLWPGDDDL